MDEVRTYLFGGEEVALAVRPHPVVLTKPAIPFLASVALLAAFWNRATLVIFLVVSARFAWDAGYWWVDRYVLTTNRILSTSGLITKNVTSMPLAKITDLTYTRSLVGRLLGYGSLVLESAGQNQGLERVDFLPDPDEFYRTVMSLALGPPSGRAQETPAMPSSSKDTPVQEAHGPAADADKGPGARPDDVVSLRDEHEEHTREVPAIWTSDD